MDFNWSYPTKFLHAWGRLQHITLITQRNNRDQGFMHSYLL